MIKRRYGRRQPPPLPAHRMLARPVAADLSPVVDLRAWCGPVKDQGQEGSCTAHAGTSAVEWIFRKYLNAQPILSPQYTYAKELLAQGDFPQDDGSDGTTLCGTLIANGCCPLELYPYVAEQITMPTEAQDAAAAAYSLGAYHGVTDSQTALSVLGDPIPWPIEIGFSVPASFESDAVATSGVMLPAKPDEQIVGGHEVLLVGFDVGDTPTLRPAKCPPAALVQNSWGTSWGIGGFFWMPLSVLDAPDSDLKIAHSGLKW